MRSVGDNVVNPSLSVYTFVIMATRDNVNSVLQEFAGRRLDDELLTVMSSVSIVEGIVVLLSIA